MKIYEFVDTFVEELRTASTTEIYSYIGKLGLALSKISNSDIQLHEKNELFRKLAFVLFYRPEAALYKNRNNHWLTGLRILVFNNFNNPDITSKFFLKAYSWLFKENSLQEDFKELEQWREPLLLKCYNFFKGIKSVREPYTTNNDSTCSIVEIGTGKHFWSLVSEGKYNGYKLDDDSSTGVMVTPWKNTSKDFREERSWFYADRSATQSFDFPVRVVMNIPNKYLSRVWIQNVNHANSYELAIVEKDLKLLRDECSINGKTSGTVTEYDPFRIRRDFDILKYQPDIQKNLNISDEEMATLSDFIKENQLKRGHSTQKEPVDFIFGNSTLTNDSESKLNPKPKL